MSVDDKGREAMQAWAKKVAAATPPMTADQRRIVAQMFAEALDEKKSASGSEENGHP